MSKEVILKIISMVPTGKVATYGQIAQLAGMGKAARYVGTTLHQLPPDTKLPWHRILNSQGKISLPEHSRGYNLQKERLLTEGVVFTNMRVNLGVYGWKP